MDELSDESENLSEIEDIEFEPKFDNEKPL